MATRVQSGKAAAGGRRNRADEVLRAAVEIFHDKGYAAASIQDVADRVGVLKGSLYHYIDSKEELLARIFEQSDRESFALIEEMEALDVDALQRLREFSRLWSLWYLRNVERASLYFNEWKHLTGDRLAGVTAQRHEYEKRIAKMIDDCKREGTADKGLDTRYACFFLLSAINGLPVWYRPRGADPAEHIANVYADMIVAMVQHTKGRKRPSKAKARARKKS
ncbi:MAG: TetR family transcriptional regulator [Actinobacteria bacterium]|nr:TetR family transcriptional regulator [Actinomycetota bacterium]